MRLTIDGLGIEYLDEGKSGLAPVVLIHPFPFDKEIWRPQIDEFKEERRVIAYDIRGMGQSDAGDCPCTIEYCVDDLFGLLRRLGTGPAILVGISMGGYIALRAVEREQQRFKGLVLCDTRSEADSDEAKIGRAMRARQVKTLGTAWFADQMLPLLLTENNTREKTGLRERLRAMIENNSAESLAQMLIALAARTDTTGSLCNIKIPTLIMVGQFDELTPPSCSMSMREKIAGSRLEIIPDAAHLPNVENPAEFNKHLKNFIDSIG